MSNTLLRLIGSKAVILHDDPTAYDRLRWIYPYLSKGNKKILDAGCGCGGFSLVAAKQGNTVIGVSFDKTANTKAQENAKILKLTNIDFLALDLRELEKHNLDKFDQIMCFETLEHILDDKRVIKNLASLLSAGGKIFITTPYKYYKPLLGDHISEIENGAHVRWGYTHEEMTTLLEEAGIKVISLEYISGFLSQQLTNLIRILSKINLKFAWYITLPLRILLIPDRLITKLLKYPHLSIGVIGEKV